MSSRNIWMWENLDLWSEWKIVAFELSTFQLEFNKLSIPQILSLQLAKTQSSNFLALLNPYDCILTSVKFVSTIKKFLSLFSENLLWSLSRWQCKMRIRELAHCEYDAKRASAQWKKVEKVQRVSFWLHSRSEHIIWKCKEETSQVFQIYHHFLFISVF
jgi:hypothetical protein